jgi:hypothetical protein
MMIKVSCLVMQLTVGMTVYFAVSNEAALSGIFASAAIIWTIIYLRASK